MAQWRISDERRYYLSLSERKLQEERQVKEKLMLDFEKTLADIDRSHA